MKKIAIAMAVFVSLLIPGYAHADEPVVLVSVSPTSGDIDGGNTVTVTGSGFTEATRVRVGSSFVDDIFVSSTQMTIIMPARSAGFVSISVISGMSGPVLTNAYEYIDIPDPEPTPEPEPEPSPEPTPTPEPVSAPAPASPSVSSVVQEIPQEVVPQPIQQGTVQQENVQQTAVQEVENFPIYRYSNNITVFTNDTQMNVVVTNLSHKRLRYTLQKRINGSWKNVAISFRNKNGEVTFYGVPLSSGSYRLVNAGKSVKWFSVPLANSGENS